MNNYKKYSIGTTYSGHNSVFLKAIVPLVDHIALSADLIAMDYQHSGAFNKEKIAEIISHTKRLDLHVIDSGLAIGSYDGYAHSYIKLLEELFCVLPVKSHSESIAYTMINNNYPGEMLTLPKTDKALDIICKRIEWIQKKLKISFLIENSSCLYSQAESAYSDAGFINLISQKTGCGLILDIFNLECSTNFNYTKVCDFMNELNTDLIFNVNLTGRLAEITFQNDLDRSTDDFSNLQVLSMLLKKSHVNLKSVTYNVNDHLLSKMGIQNVKKQLLMLDSIFNTRGQSFNPVSNRLLNQIN